MRIAMLSACVAIALAGAACTEKPQTKAAGADDAAAYMGTGTPYVAQGWKAGDQASWDEQLRARTQRGQNEYTRVSGD